MDYSREVEKEAQRIFDFNFNSLNFELLKKAVGENSIIEFIVKPSNEIIETEAKDNFDDEEWQKMSKEEREEATDNYYYESEHYPMWLTVFEAKDDMLSEKIMNDIDTLYKLGIGVIAPTDNSRACLFIAGAGYNFYHAHWIPLFERWGWVDTKKIEQEVKEKEELAKLGICKATKLDLMDLSRDKDKTIKRHAEGLLKALKL